MRAQHSKITSSYNEGIMGAKTSKTLALESRLTDEFEQTTANAARAGILHGRMRAIYVPMILCSAARWRPVPRCCVAAAWCLRER